MPVLLFRLWRYYNKDANKDQNNLAVGGIAANYRVSIPKFPFSIEDRDGSSVIHCYLGPQECLYQMASHSA